MSHVRAVAPRRSPPDGAEPGRVEHASASDLPVWDLGDLYPSPDAPELTADLEKAAGAATAFQARYRGKLAGLAAGESGPAAVRDAIAAYEAIQEILGRVGSYATLVYTADTSDPANGKLYGDLQARLTAISSDLLFFQLELNRLDADLLARLTEAPTLAAYRGWLADLRDFAPYQIETRLEELLHDKDLTGRAAWVRAYDETLAGLRFTVDPDGEPVTLENALNELSEPDRDRRMRAASAIGDELARAAPRITHILNTLVQDKATEDRWRGMAEPALSRHLANHVEGEVVAALAAAVRDAYPRLAHRYYALKARWLGLDKLQYWDRNAPVPFADDRRFTWDEARTAVLEAYGTFSLRMKDEAARFFERPWIDAAVRPGKASGAFSHPTVPSAHPYILLNYKGRTRDVMTLAHELGHGVHQLLAAPQGLLMANTPLTLAETASVFGEMLTFRRLLDAATDPAERRALIAGKVEDMLNTVVRQIAFYSFEEKVHAARRAGELTTADVGRIWLEVQGESLGPAFDFAPGYEHYWTYVSHFFHAPFYVYAYAFGDGLVNALYAQYQQAEDGFVDRYMDLLSAGGSKRYDALLAPFGLDARDPAFWQLGLSVIEGLIDELEAGDGG